MINIEHWRPVVGFEGLYEVSDLGHVRSAPRKGTRGGLLRPTPNRFGHPHVYLMRAGRKTTISVHKLIAHAFLGPANGRQVRHIDGVAAHSVLTNLEYGSQSDNTLDSVRHGTHNQASKTHCPQGHGYDPQNTWREPKTGRRHCRSCGRDRMRARRAKAA